MSNAARARRGSNQYATKPGTGDNSADMRRSAAEGVGQPDQSERVVWAFDPESEAWRDVGITAWDVAESWRAAAFRPSEAASWYQPELTGKWEQGQFAPGVARAWARFGFVALEAHGWSAVGLGPADADEWEHRQMNASDVALFEKVGVTDLREAHWWVLLVGFTHAMTVGRWKECGFDIGQAEEWADAGVAKPNADQLDRAASWLRAGFRSGTSTSNGFEGWEAARFSREAVEWRTNGWTYVEASELRDDGLTAATASRRRETGERYAELVYPDPLLR